MKRSHEFLTAITLASALAAMACSSGSSHPSPDDLSGLRMTPSSSSTVPGESGTAVTPAPPIIHTVVQHTAAEIDALPRVSIQQYRETDFASIMEAAYLNANDHTRVQAEQFIGYARDNINNPCGVVAYKVPAPLGSDFLVRFAQRSNDLAAPGISNQDTDLTFHAEHDAITPPSASAGAVGRISQLYAPPKQENGTQSANAIFEDWAATPPLATFLVWQLTGTPTEIQADTVSEFACDFGGQFVHAK